MIYEGLLAETVRLSGHAGDEIGAYVARPLGPGPYPGVVVVHHMPGRDEATKEITRRFAAHDYAALCPHLHYREGPEASPDDAAAAARAAGGVSDERFLGDAEGALRYLRALPYASGKVGIIGYCSGGRQAYLAACRLPLDAAVDCYGAFVAAPPPDGLPLRVEPIIALTDALSCPVLGLFGAEDPHPSSAETGSPAKLVIRFRRESDISCNNAQQEHPQLPKSSGDPAEVTRATSPLVQDLCA